MNARKPIPLWHFHSVQKQPLDLYTHCIHTCVVYTTIPCLCHHCTISLPSLCHHCTISSPSLYHHQHTIPSLSLNHIVLSLYHHCTFSSPSLHHLCAVLCQLESHFHSHRTWSIIIITAMMTYLKSMILSRKSYIGVRPIV